jgi:hypothetical protein
MRFAVAFTSVLTIAACSSKPPSTKETGSSAASGRGGGGETIIVPGAKGAEGAAPNFGGSGANAGAVAAANSLQPNEGTLAIQAPPDATAGAEATAKIVITPATSYHVNTEFPVKLELQPPSGVTLPKALFVAGGDKGKGDADAFDEQQLAFAVKLTPAQAGNVTVSGTIKFAVCDKDSCLPKKEPVTIAFAVK